MGLVVVHDSHGECARIIPPEHDVWKRTKNPNWFFRRRFIGKGANDGWVPQLKGILRRVDANVPGTGGTDPDGPHGIYQWRHDGIVTTDKMQPMTWKLAEYLYERISRKVPYGDLIGQDRLFGDGVIEDQRIARQGNKAKCWFEEHKIPLTVSSSTTEHLIWMEAVSSE